MKGFGVEHISVFLLHLLHLLSQALVPLGFSTLSEHGPLAVMVTKSLSSNNNPGFPKLLSASDEIKASLGTGCRSVS